MSYVGYIPFLKQYLNSTLSPDHVPSVLEIGVDRGTTLVPLVVNLIRTRPRFLFVGIDVLVQEQLLLTVRNIDVTEEQRAYIIQDNSLTILPQLVKSNTKFDLLLIDGDHNYHTVSSELEYVESLTHPHSIVVVDDYDGRWSERDLWYVDRPGYEECKLATAKVETEKHGVKIAVDEWLERNPDWQLHKLLPGEPIMLTRKGVFTFTKNTDAGAETSGDVSVDEWLQSPT